jgi:hypothetical protein
MLDSIDASNARVSSFGEKQVARMSRKEPWLWLLAALLFVACAAPVLAPITTPYPLPSGARALALPTRGPPASGVVGCPAIGPVGPVVMQWDRNAHTVSFSFEPWGGSDTILWPDGFSAREYLGRAELVAPDGSVVARDGDAVSGILGSDPSGICEVAGKGYF